MRRVLWFAVGAGVGAYALVKVRQYAASASPRALAGSATTRAKDSVATLADGARDFVDRVRAAMVEREAELRDAVGLAPEPQPSDRPRLT